MSFIDQQRTYLPDGWEKFNIHTEVYVVDYDSIHHLEETKWVYFADGGHIIGSHDGIDTTNKTRWYGLTI